MILVPVKNLENAKQRLASLLDHDTRTELAQAMLHDVLDALSACCSYSEISLVTSDPFVLDLAQAFSFQVISDATNRSETDAIEMATQLCESRGVESTLVIPADIPLIQSSEVTTILQAAPEEGSVLVPAADGRGTNAVFVVPLLSFRCASATTASSRISRRRTRAGNRALCSHCPASRSTSIILRIWPILRALPEIRVRSV